MDKYKLIKLCEEAANNCSDKLDKQLKEELFKKLEAASDESGKVEITRFLTEFSFTLYDYSKRFTLNTLVEVLSALDNHQ